MSTILYIEDRFICLFDYLLSESIKPAKIEYGTNKDFNNEKFFRVNNMVGTSFVYDNKLYSVILNEGNIVGFHFSYIKDIDFNDFNYFENVLRVLDYKLEVPAHAAKVFGLVFFILLEMVSKYNLKYIKFDAEHTKLDKFYDTLFSNKLFVKEFEERGYEFVKEGKFFTFNIK